jgi:hypothetical protein
LRVEEHKPTHTVSAHRAIGKLEVREARTSPRLTGFATTEVCRVQGSTPRKSPDRARRRYPPHVRFRRDEPISLDLGRVMLAMWATRTGKTRLPFVPTIRQLTPLGLAMVVGIALGLLGLSALLTVSFR